MTFNGTCGRERRKNEKETARSSLLFCPVLSERPLLYFSLSFWKTFTLSLSRATRCALLLLASQFLNISVGRLRPRFLSNTIRVAFSSILWRGYLGKYLGPLTNIHRRSVCERYEESYALRSFLRLPIRPVEATRCSEGLTAPAATSRCKTAPTKRSTNKMGENGIFE